MVYDLFHSWQSNPQKDFAKRTQAFRCFDFWYSKYTQMQQISWKSLETKRNIFTLNM